MYQCLNKTENQMNMDRLSHCNGSKIMWMLKEGDAFKKWYSQTSNHHAFEIIHLPDPSSSWGYQIRRYKTQVSS